MKVFSDAEVRMVEQAVKEDPTIQCLLKDVSSHAGNSTAYLDSLGLNKAVLKRMEVWGLAKRGYRPDKDGAKCRWVLIKPETPDA